MPSTSFTWNSYLLRLGLSLLLVLATYNPLGYSYLHWLIQHAPMFTAFKVLTGLLLILAWIVLFHATFRSLGKWGLALVMIFFGLLFWVLFGGFIVSTNQEQGLTISRAWLQWIFLMVLSLTLSVGISWSHIKKRLAGQLDVDEVDT